MENILLVGLSRQVALGREMDVVANNIANINTIGYKADGSLFAEYLSSNAAGGAGAGGLGRISFVQDSGVWHDMNQGALERTGNPLDIAIDGQGYLVVQTRRGERYTRNGSLQINAQGQLVTGDGDPVMGDGGPIRFQTNDQQIAISRDGTISARQGGSNVDSPRGRLRVVDFASPRQLQKDGGGTFSAVDGAAPTPIKSVAIVQGAVEKSNVRGVVEMSRMIEISRAYTEVANLLQQQGDISQQAIDKLAEVPN